MMLAHLYYVCLPVFCLLYCIMSAYLYNVCLLVLCIVCYHIEGSMKLNAYILLLAHMVYL
jgi:hypothetical protein